MSDVPPREDPHRVPLSRAAMGGVLMGLANLVPGISGGTMLLASGVYTAFIEGIAELSTLRFRRRAIVTIATVVIAALAAIVLAAAPVRHLVVHQRWAMYSLFIGLTLGGVPLLRRLIGRSTGGAIVGALLGIAAMAGLALAPEPTGEATGAGAIALLVIGGAAAGSAMILPGISGSYLLLLLGLYLPVLDAVASLKTAATARDVGALGESARTLVPVVVGIVLGVVGVSNLLKALLARFEKATLGVLLGLLLGAVLGLWPFRAPVPPQVGDVVRGREIATVEEAAAVSPKYWRTETFAPNVGMAAASVGLVVAGFAASLGVGRLGSGRPDRR